MYQYIKGKIVDLDSKCIVLENQDIGYLINVSNPFVYKIGDMVTVYIYQHIREDSNQFFGFQSKELKDLFLKLLSVKGIGPKSALAILATGSISGIVGAIESENILYLKKFPGIGPKAAQQIILDLKGKLSSVEEVNTNNYDDVVEALVSLGYKKREAVEVTNKIESGLSEEDAIKESLKLLLK